MLARIAMLAMHSRDGLIALIWRRWDWFRTGASGSVFGPDAEAPLILGPVRAFDFQGFSARFFVILGERRRPACTRREQVFEQVRSGAFSAAISGYETLVGCPA